MKKLVGMLFLFMIFTVGASAQTACPEGLVCMTKAAATNLLQQSDENASLKEVIKAKDAAIVARDKALEVERSEKVNFQVKWAQSEGENTELRASRVRDAALMDILIKNARPKKLGLINLF